MPIVGPPGSANDTFIEQLVANAQAAIDKGQELGVVKGQVESQFGFEIVFARTEIGGYCSHCQVLRAQDEAQGAADRG